MNIREILRKFNFSKKEVDVYLTLLTLGPSVARDIAKETKINRSTTYMILDMLLEQNLVELVENHGIKKFFAIQPKKLVARLELKAKEYKKLAASASKILSKLKVKKNEIIPDVPRVKLFKGDAEMKNVYEDALSSLETIRSYAFTKDFPNIEQEKYLKTLQKKNIKVKMLLPDTAESKEITKISKNLSAFNTEISVYDNKVALISPNEGFALIIESKELSKAFKKAFDLSWEENKKLNKNSFAPETS